MPLTADAASPLPYLLMKPTSLLLPLLMLVAIFAGCDADEAAPGSTPEDPAGPEPAETRTFTVDTQVVRLPEE